MQDKYGGTYNAHENQFEQISAKINSQSINNFHRAHELSDYISDGNDEATQFLQKLTYYKKLSSQNKQLYKQLKALDTKLNDQLRTLDMKKINTNGKLKPRIKSERAVDIVNKYKELDVYKRQLEEKLLQKSSLQELINRVDKLKSMHREKYMEVQLKEKKLRKLKEMLDAKEKQQSKLLKNSILVSDGYQDEIKQLKQKIKTKTTVIYEQKNKFIEEFRSKKKNESSMQLTRPKNETHEQHESPEIEQLKKKYEALGRRIEVLKSQKKAEMEKNSELEERSKYLQKLKSKLKQLTKI